MKILTGIRITVAIWSIALFGVPAFGGILVANKTSKPIAIFLRGTKELDYRPEFKIDANSELEISVAPGRYEVVTRLPNDRWHFMGWQDYSNHKITYKVSLCVKCGYRAPSGSKSDPHQAAVPITETQVAHSESYRCKKCGKYHTRWRSGWGKSNAEGGVGIIYDHGEGEEFDSYGVYRLGISVVDAENGAMVSDVSDQSPGHQLRRIDRADDLFYQLSPGINVITHLNGNRVRNTVEFAAALAAAKPRITLTVANTERGSVRDYSTTLR